MKRYDTARLATAMFIASEAVFFAFLITAYIYYYGAVVHGPTAANSLNPARTLIFTLCLLASSGTLVFAERSFSANSSGFRVWLGLTILLGAVFLGGQGMEYAGLLGKNINPERNLFGATFFTLTGFHGFHVLCGLIALACILKLAWNAGESGPATRAQVSGLGAISLYWHFVDAVWVVIFSLVYVRVWIGGSGG